MGGRTHEIDYGSLGSSITSGKKMEESPQGRIIIMFN